MTNETLQHLRAMPGYKKNWREFLFVFGVLFVWRRSLRWPEYRRVCGKGHTVSSFSFLNFSVGW